MSFFCASCAGWYCRKHWKLETFFDDGFYDYTMGTCHHGHRRKVDDFGKAEAARIAKVRGFSDER